MPSLAARLWAFVQLDADADYFGAEEGPVGAVGEKLRGDEGVRWRRPE